MTPIHKKKTVKNWKKKKYRQIKRNSNQDKRKDQWTCLRSESQEATCISMARRLSISLSRGRSRRSQEISVGKRRLLLAS